MTPSVYASFDSVEQAQQAIAALIRAGTPASDIRLACKHADSSELNKAQDDYPRSGDAVVTELSSAPPDAPGDDNSGIEANDYNRDYEGDAERDTDRDNVDGQEFGAMGASFPDLRAPGPGNSSGDPSTATPGIRFSGIASSAGASADLGHMTDQLWASLPADLARRYHEQFEDGKAIVIVQGSSDAVAQVLRDAGGRVQTDGYLA